MKANSGQPNRKAETRSLMEDILEDALAIQDRFIAEPMLKKTGRGVLKSRGIESLKQDAEELRERFSNANRPKV
jgi:hypothetical protein